MADLPQLDSLTEDARRGDPAAWGALYRRHEAAVYGFVYHRVGRDRALADDVFHDAFLKAVERIETFDPERGSFDAWLCGIARNEVRRRVRARTVDPLPQGLAAEVPADDAASLHRHVNQTLTVLSSRQQRALTLKYQQGRSLEEIAAELETTPAAVGSLLHRARAAFRQAWEQPGGDA